MLVWLAQHSTVRELPTHPAFDAATLLTCDPLALRQTASLWHSVAPRSIRTRAGWQVISRGDAQTRDAWLEAARMPPLVRYIVQRGANTDALNVLLVPAYQLAQSGFREITTGSPSSSSLDWISGVPAYAYCLYSGPGRSALRHFLATHPQWADRFRKLGVIDGVRALGNLVFHVEGDFCSRVVEVSRGAQIATMSEAATLDRFGVPPSAISQLENHLVDALPDLNISRRSIGGNHG
ncbi:MAG: hypothetical protein ABJA62_00885 [Luteimonas sp.]